MVAISLANCQKFYHTICICATLAMTAWCFLKYCLDKDVSLVAFVTFNHNENNIYPALTICFWNPFLNEKLKTYGDGINATTYSKFLQGKSWDPRMLDIDYDDVTVSIEDYLTEIGFQFSNFSTRIWKKDFKIGRHYEGMPEGYPSFYVSNRNGKNKCFSFTIPYVYQVPIISFFTRMNSSIFPNGKRAAYPAFDGSNLDAGGFMAFLHYPGEHFRSYFDKKYSWPERNNNTKNYDMVLTVKNMEVLKHRNKVDKPCNQDWKNDDDIVMRKIMHRVGCKPPHWKIDANLKPCSTEKEIAQFKWPTYATLKNFPPPCQVIEKLQYDYEEFDEKYPQDNSSSWVGISLFFPEPSYKEIKQVQAYDLESFVGNTGGYIGLFLGYALLSLPSFIATLYGTIRKRVQAWQEKWEIQNHKNGRETTLESVSTMVEMPSLENEHDIEKKVTAILKIVTTINERQMKLENKFSDLQHSYNESSMSISMNEPLVQHDATYRL